MPMTRTWILVADGAHARIFRAQGRVVETVMELETKIPPSREIETDRPGRGQRRAHSTTRHGFETGVDAHRSAKLAFVRSVAGAIDGGFKAKAFDRLVVVAPPQALGDIRKTLGAG
jgi:protein required for attachment to host cells